MAKHIPKQTFFTPNSCICCDHRCADAGACWPSWTTNKRPHLRISSASAAAAAAPLAALPLVFLKGSSALSRPALQHHGPPWSKAAPALPPTPPYLLVEHGCLPGTSRSPHQGSLSGQCSLQAPCQQQQRQLTVTLTAHSVEQALVGADHAVHRPVCLGAVGAAVKDGCLAAVEAAAALLQPLAGVLAGPATGGADFDPGEGGAAAGTAWRPHRPAPWAVRLPLTVHSPVASTQLPPAPPSVCPTGHIPPLLHPPDLPSSGCQVIFTCLHAC